MTSKAARKHRRRNRNISLPGGESVTPPPNGLPRLHVVDTDPEPRAVVIAARMRRTGLCDKAAVDPVLGTEMGLCINHMTSGDERAALINTWAALSACRRNYMVRYIGQSGEPQGAAIGFIPDAMQTDPSLRVDIRSTEERAAQAKASWAAWDAKIKALPLGMAWAIRGALQGFMGEASLWRDKAPTDLGRIGVAGLRVLTNGT